MNCPSPMMQQMFQSTAEIGEVVDALG
jgi:hypothetical protein